MFKLDQQAKNVTEWLIKCFNEKRLHSEKERLNCEKAKRKSAKAREIPQCETELGLQ